MSQRSRSLAALMLLAAVGLILPVIQVSPSSRAETSLAASDEPCHTFSIVAYDPEQQEWGVGVASRVVAVGAVVPFAQAGTGAIATQSWANKSYGPRGLKMLAEGKAPKEVIEALTSADEKREFRQVGIIDAKGNTAHFTGKECNAYAGAKSGKNYSCQGNLLAGEAVIDDMASAFEESSGPLAWRILAALTAADKAGGDRRGKQSAAILIVHDGKGYFGFDDRMIDLRVDDHKEPISELARILALRIPRPREKGAK